MKAQFVPLMVILLLLGLSDFLVALYAVGSRLDTEATEESVHQQLTQNLGGIALFPHFHSQVIEPSNVGLKRSDSLGSYQVAHLGNHIAHFESEPQFRTAHPPVVFSGFPVLAALRIRTRKHGRGVFVRSHDRHISRAH